SAIGQQKLSVHTERFEHVEKRYAEHYENPTADSDWVQSGVDPENDKDRNREQQSRQRQQQHPPPVATNGGRSLLRQEIRQGAREWIFPVLHDQSDAALDTFRRIMTSRGSLTSAALSTSKPASFGRNSSQ